MAKNIYEELLRKHTLEELKERIPAEKSLERLVSSSPVPSTPKSPLPLVDSQERKSRNEYRVDPEFYGGWILLTAAIVVAGVMGHIVKRDPQYEFNGYIGKEKVYFYETALLNTDRIEVEKENGIKIIYQSAWQDDDKLAEVISVKSGEETILCEENSCSDQITKIALEYKQKILETKGFNEAFKK